MRRRNKRTAFEDAKFEDHEIKRASVKGAATNYVSQIIRFGLLFVYQILIARLLNPADFGLLAMTAPLFAFASLFTDFGFTQATIQRKDINQNQLSFIFWCNVGLSVVAAILVASCAGLAASFYGEPRVTPIIFSLTITFIIAGLYAQHLALLNRRLEFQKLAVIDLSSFIVGAAVGLVSAVYGLSYWSLVLNQLAASVTTLLLAWFFSGWMPGLFKNVKDNRDLIGVGANVTSFNLVNFFARNLDNILIGRYLGGVQLGVYDRAYKLLLLPLSQITGPIAKVALPALSRTVESPEKYKRAYMRMLEVVLLVTYPGVVFAMVNSELLIVSVLGARWSDVSPVFSILAIGALFAPISNSTGWLFLSQNRSREMRNWGVISSVAFAISFVCGLPWGIEGVAALYIGVGAIQGPLLWWAATRKGPLTTGELFGRLFPYAAGAVVVFVFEWGFARWLVTDPLLHLTLQLILAYLIFLGFICLFKSSRSAALDIATEAWALARRVLPTKRFG